VTRLLKKHNLQAKSATPLPPTTPLSALLSLLPPPRAPPGLIPARTPLHDLSPQQLHPHLPIIYKKGPKLQFDCCERVVVVEGGWWVAAGVAPGSGGERKFGVV
jgi:hypothetical protein